MRRPYPSLPVQAAFSALGSRDNEPLVRLCRTHQRLCNYRCPGESSRTRCSSPFEPLSGFRSPFGGVQPQQPVRAWSFPGKRFVLYSGRSCTPSDHSNTGQPLIVFSSVFPGLVVPITRRFSGVASHFVFLPSGVQFPYRQVPSLCLPLR